MVSINDIIIRIFVFDTHRTFIRGSYSKDNRIIGQAVVHVLPCFKDSLLTSCILGVLIFDIFLQMFPNTGSVCLLVVAVAREESTA
jgi:hypothetical protein